VSVGVDCAESMLLLSLLLLAVQEKGKSHRRRLGRVASCGCVVIGDCRTFGDVPG
jgi:hypothetical protein